MSQPELSIIVPACNEEGLIAGTLDALHQYLAARPDPYEIVVVDDGSRDKTAAVAEAWGRGREVSLRVLVNGRNMGKGFAVRRGVEESRGRYLIFIDADLPYELDAIERFVRALRDGSDVAVGSRALPESEARGLPTLRWMAGKVFSWMVQGVLFLGIHDTQCGFKSFRSDAAKQIFRRVTVSGFGFDVEVLHIARKLKYVTTPVAVRLTRHRSESRVRIVRDSLQMLADLFVIRVNDWRGRYR